MVKILRWILPFVFTISCHAYAQTTTIPCTPNSTDPTKGCTPVTTTAPLPVYLPKGY
jgi:hypothetical protein